MRPWEFESPLSHYSTRLEFCGLARPFTVGVVLPSVPLMDALSPPSLFHGVFELNVEGHGAPRVATRPAAPRSIPDPQTGRLLKIATVELSEHSVCPACTQLGPGGYVSFESDLRLAFACPSCRTLVWVAGA